MQRARTVVKTVARAIGEVEAMTGMAGSLKARTAAPRSALQFVNFNTKRRRATTDSSHRALAALIVTYEEKTMTRNAPISQRTESAPI